MKKIFLIALLLCSALVQAQDLVVGTGYLESDYHLPDNVGRQVQSKLMQALTQNGVSAIPGGARFAMVPKVVVNNEETTTTIPVFSDVDFDLEISLTEVYTGKVFATTTMNVKGRGANKVNAISKGISSVRLNTPAFARFIDSARQKVMDYYKTNGLTVVAEAKKELEMCHYDRAIALLAEIPESASYYEDKVAPLFRKFMKEAVDMTGETLLTKARAAWSASPDEQGALVATALLARIPAGSASLPGAYALMENMEAQVAEIDWQRWKLKERQLDYAHAERTAMIEAARDVSVAWAENQPDVIYKVRYYW